MQDVGNQYDTLQQNATHCNPIQSSTATQARIPLDKKKKQERNEK